MKSILITGASSGIGRALALEFAAPGVHLALTGRDAARLAGVAVECRARGAHVRESLIDVRDRAGMAAWIAALDDASPLDLVIPNAGITTGLGAGRVTEDPDAVRAILEISLIGVLNTVDPVLPRMLARGRGKIGFMGSLAAFRPLPYSPAYCAAKAAVHAYAGGLRAGLEPHGLRVCLIAPGFVATALNRDIRSWKPLQMTDARAARIIRRGLERGRAVIAFPWPLYAATRLLDLLPARAVDWGMRRARVDIPETRERPVGSATSGGAE
jgi:NADP-dependent 3-hydroxy acid dehydrogenase YdfG